MCYLDAASVQLQVCTAVPDHGQVSCVAGSPVPACTPSLPIPCLPHPERSPLKASVIASDLHCLVCCLSVLGP